MKTAKLTEINTGSRKKVNRLLADVKAMKATQVVLWYAIGGEETGVLISEGTDRVKAVGGLNSAAYDVWNE